MTNDDVLGTIGRYFEALGADDGEAFAALFSEDVHFEDPVGGTVLTGRDGVMKFHRGVARAWESLDMQAEDVFVRGSRAAVYWDAEGRSRSGKDIDFDGINVLVLDDDGLIRRMEGYWDFEDVIAQM